MRHPGINYWAFSGNPRYYRVEDAVRELKEDFWTVPNRDVQAGDRAIIWKAKGNERLRGIIALAEILTNPLPMKDPNPQYWVDQDAANEVVDRVQIRYFIPPALPLWEGETNLKVLEERELSVARATGGTVFHVTLDHWDAILQEVGGWPAPEIEDAELAIAELAGKNRSGQGFRMDVAARQAIEQHAMQAAKIYFEEQGWAVTDVSATCSYDLVCKRNNGEELHVEVKGTTSDGQQILLTRNEVEHARYRYPHVALFVLANIKIEKTSTGGIRPGDGERHLLEPWNVDDGMLTPLAYAYKIKMSEKNREEVK
jgi:hypothetical protein